MADNHCPICRTWSFGGKTCTQVACLACGKVQCFSSGAARGTCRYCFYGMIPGWSKNNDPSRPELPVIRCTYARCNEPAVYRHLPGPRPIACRMHGAGVIERQEARRRKRRRALPQSSREA